MDTKLFVRKQAGGMFSIVDKSVAPGNVFYVDSGHTAASDAAGFGTNPDSPVAPIVTYPQVDPLRQDAPPCVSRRSVGAKLAAHILAHLV